MLKSLLPKLTTKLVLVMHSCSLLVVRVLWIMTTVLPGEDMQEGLLIDL